jgi:hypothetical protein
MLIERKDSYKMVNSLRYHTTNGSFQCAFNWMKIITIFVLFLTIMIGSSFGQISCKNILSYQVFLGEPDEYKEVATGPCKSTVCIFTNFNRMLKYSLWMQQVYLFE